jgi:outer membrane lipoprotein-sorting protein
MKTKLLLIAVLTFGSAVNAAINPAKLQSDLERHLQSLKSLEIRYEAEGASLGEGSVTGRMIWARPDKFYHDTPEWTLCEIDDEQWRHLKVQNTLIREAALAQERWTPEHVLFDLGKSFHAKSVEKAGDGAQSLTLISTEPNAPGSVVLEFPPESRVPNRIRFQLPDGTATEYRITGWKENVTVDANLFTPPLVPPENLIDFRAAQEGVR